MTGQPNAPGRVLMTADTIGGVWTYAIDLARALGDEGIKVVLATMGRPASTGQRRDADAIATLELVESPFRLPWMDDPWNDVAAAGEWLLELSSEVGPDVIHLNDPVHASLPWNAPVVAVGHSCVLSWWQAVWNAPAPASWDRYHREMRRGLAAADAVVAPSEPMLQALRHYYQVEHGHVIPNGRDPTHFRPGDKEALIFAAGRVWDPAKNLLALDKVAERLTWPVYVAGEPRHPDRADSAGTEHMCLLGCLDQEEIGLWLRRASIYAFPARYEPFGLSVLEAALAGCALVLSDLPTLRQLWGGEAVFVDPDDPVTMRMAIQALIDDSRLRGTLAMRARRHALTLTPRRMALAYSQVYSTIMAQRNPVLERPACAS
ncbi:MAG: glycosyltransferase family 4 protein [Gemmatimonadales bacterium]